MTAQAPADGSPFMDEHDKWEETARENAQRQAPADVVLKACPFCGGKARTFPYNGTAQAGCADTYTNCAGADVFAPLAMWNTRAPLAAAPALDREAVARIIYDDLEGPVANQDFTRQTRQWNQCLRITDAILAALSGSEGKGPLQAEPQASGDVVVPEGMMTLADELEDKADELDMMDARGQIWGLEEVSYLLRRAREALSTYPTPPAPQETRHD